MSKKNNKEQNNLFYCAAGEDNIYDNLDELIEELDLDDGTKIEIYELKEVKTLKKYTLI